MNPTNTCEGSALTTVHQATRRWVASIIKERLKAFPHYKPKDIVTDIKQEFGIQLNYYQAWRGKEIAREQLQGSYKNAYNLLPLFCDRIMETNPGSLATYSTKEDSSFHRHFIAFHASLCGFLQGCRPLLFLDSIPLNSKYQDTLLAATAADGDDGVFPVAFSVIDAENDENWYWFLLQLKSALSTSCPISFFADIQKGLRESISEIFKGSYHGYCLHYLTQLLIRDLKGHFSHEMKRHMIDDLHNAALAPRPELFQSYLESIKKISLEAYNWLGIRCTRITHHSDMVDVIRKKIMELIYTRRATSDQWLTRLTPCMEDRLEKVRTLQVLLTTGSIFEVRGESTEIVDMDHWDCSCKDVERPLKKDSSLALVTVTPPPTGRPPGRPTTKKVRSQEVMKRQLQCSRCKGLGHNKSTCKELL
ncbi:hypothetical protein F3Y22_tig00111671pilonHSYRG00274 [Hibiscus syriacus]|uniref:MULE transposase domain-containing protein n=1 Tax=Hibiscus syriacus TaxID=106335 RepID=A0A6A2YFL3_HIBSY|nr:hypothetical protein F3Y22_tig00111671pilonHSYRG00274 [Hibiscus syriacus]